MGSFKSGVHHEAMQHTYPKANDWALSCICAKLWCHDGLKFSLLPVSSACSLGPCGVIPSSPQCCQLSDNVVHCFTKSTPACKLRLATSGNVHSTCRICTSGSWDDIDEASLLHVKVSWTHYKPPLEIGHADTRLMWDPQGHQDSADRGCIYDGLVDGHTCRTDRTRNGKA